MIDVFQKQGLLAIRGLIRCFLFTGESAPSEPVAIPFLSFGSSPRGQAKSRDFDGFEIDDFSLPERDVDRSPAPGTRSGWDVVWRLAKIRNDEERADQRDREAREASGSNRAPLPREERVQLVLARTSRTNFVDRTRIFQLCDSELHALTEVGKFRIVATHDLAEFATTAIPPVCKTTSRT